LLPAGFFLFRPLALARKLFATVGTRIAMCQPKHLCILKILYGCGLRVSEVLALKITDIDSDAMCLMVREAKGKKDRALPLPQTLLYNLRQYYLAYRPEVYLFEGQKGGKYTAKSIQNFIKKYAREANIQKTVTPHMLRHSYATHQLENGVNISYVQELLGHNSIKTTELYTHVTKISKNKIASPLDQL
jgi:site-specific recombinase XerD